MAPSRRTIVLAAAAGSAALLAGAFFFQMLGYAPCKLCLWQRWPHGAAVALGLAGLWRAPAPLVWAGAAAAAASGALGLYHVGVEQFWWPGPDTCTAAPLGEVSTADLLEQIMNAPLVRCDEVAWMFLGLSMAAWNAILSLALAGLWLFALRRA